YYCDTVIELSDGRIAGTRSNEGTDGYVAKNRNDIYLGELDHRTEEGEIGIDLYGPAPAEPVRLKIVNSNGRIYLKVEEGRVQILDESSEIRLREGVFEEKAREASGSRVDMSELPPVKAEKTGRLFTFASSVKSGYSSNFKNRSRQGRVKRPMLLSVLMIFSAVMVILTAVLGTSVKKISDINRSYNHNTMYVYTEGAQREKLAAAAADPASAIDALKPYTYPGQSTLTFDGGSFETLGVSAFSQRDVSFSADGTPLPSSLLKGRKAVAGRIDGLKAGEIVISAGMADLLLERSTYSYIKDYRDLLGLSTRVPASRGDLRVVGISDADETAYYLSAADIAEAVFSQMSIGIGRASWLKVTQPAEGEAVFFTYPYRHAGEFPEKEQYEITKSDVLAKHPTVVICGREYRVVEVVFRDEYWSRDDVASEYGYRYFYYGFLLNDSDYAAAAADVAKESDSLVYEDPGYIDNGGTSYYTMIHSTDIAATEAYIERIFEGENLRDDAVITPEIFRRQLIADERADIASRLISIGVFAAVMCVCMYFMMRSSLLGRVKEIGIYRAIGVTKRNVLFRFLIEAAVLTTLTVFVMYLLTSGALFYLQTLSKSLSKTLWYPGWMAACLLVFQYALCLICGIAPVASLLRRTPAEILAKYDI
ncbi:MAG: ABC transporter permease, partial [Clostridia bacterium]|nr:ABC transporter permease [Clostridia bacterium]